MKCCFCRYLQVEWDNKKAASEGARTFDKDSVKGSSPKCPQQTNFSDCGVYVLQYVESFFQVGGLFGLSKFGMLIIPLLSSKELV